ncbi:MAG: hypothetical protein ABIC40_06375 [bacterium]
MTSGQESTDSSGNHYLWGYYLVKIDPETMESEIVPVRQAETHLNVVKYLEQGTCKDCFKISSILPGLAGTLDIGITIKHPFDTSFFTGFDVRGIAMFNGSRVFPDSGLRMSDSSLGDGELMNADGYTTLYNPTTISHGPFGGYFKGKLATQTIPNATLNGFKRYQSNPFTFENIFRAGDDVTATYNLKIPKPVIFGYAIDASWYQPINNPVQDITDDFPISAHCPESWRIDVTNLGPVLFEQEGTTTFEIQVFDYQGKESNGIPLLECPELFTGTIEAEFKKDGPIYSVWQVTIENENHASAGIYPCIISVEDNLNDPVGKPWLDLTAYQIVRINVSDASLDSGNLIWVKSAGEPGGGKGYAVAALPDDSTVVTGCFSESAIFGQGEPNETVLESFGEADIFIARYNTDGTLVWVKQAGGEGIDFGLANTTLSDNSVVVTGFFEKTALFGQNEPNQTMLVSADHLDIFVARYNSDGTLAWAKRAGGTGNGFPYGIATLSDDSVIVAGEFMGSTTFGEGEPNEIMLDGFSEADSEIFIARYNSDGTLAWAKRAGGKYGQYAYSVTSLSDDSIVITGTFYNSATFGAGESKETVLTAVDGYSLFDIFVARYNSDGLLEWAKRAGGHAEDGGNAITTLSDDSVVVTGYFQWKAKFGAGEANETVLIPEGPFDIFIARYNPDGTLAWAKSAGGTSEDRGLAVTALSDDSVVITGHIVGMVKFGSGETNETVLNPLEIYDICIARYKSDGLLAWAKCAGGKPSWIYNEGDAITTLSDDSTIVTGRYINSVVFGPGEPNETTLVSTAGSDIFLARFMP